ncbi:unnamed protein product [Linum tenue]|uniref:Uncharacterized protein n=1 Tax=Linum tenue TaxID=586396 RepID=A0AAV0MN88_9ROSI|nr:unnamed protein product [Linum tenue]
MLCLKAEAYDDRDLDLDPTIKPADASSCNNNNKINASPDASSTGFLLPINFGSSLHKYFWKMGKMSTRSISSGDGSPSCSVSDFEDINSQERKIPPVQDIDISVYKHQLEQDVKMLQQQLQEEIDLRLALANAVEHSNSSSDSPCQLPDKAQELLDSIAILEDNVINLEQKSVALQYQLSQERNERRIAEYRLRHFPILASSMFDTSQSNLPEMIIRPGSREKLEGKMEEKPPWSESVNEPNKDYFVEKLCHRPNQLSEAMVLCMRDIFLFLADSSKLSSSKSSVAPSSPCDQLPHPSLPSFSDTNRDDSSTRSPILDKDQVSGVSTRSCKFDPYGVPGKVEWNEGIGAYSNAVEVSWLSVGKKELEYASGALKRFRLLVEQLVEVDPSRLLCHEKLAFWINVYNALIMHAFLAYGVPRSDIKLFSLMQKAAYTIGGNSISAADIEYIILKMKPPAHRPQVVSFTFIGFPYKVLTCLYPGGTCPCAWENVLNLFACYGMLSGVTSYAHHYDVQSFVLALQRLKATDELRKFSINQPEPLLAFALSCGMYSSPAVRIYKPDNVNEMLQTSLKDYAQASTGIGSKGKILVPKLLHCFAKGMVDDSQLPEWLTELLTAEQAAMVKDCSSNRKWKLLGARSFSILPFDSRFRFLFLL